MEHGSEAQHGSVNCITVVHLAQADSFYSGVLITDFSTRIGVDRVVTDDLFGAPAMVI